MRRILASALLASLATPILMPSASAAGLAEEACTALLGFAVAPAAIGMPTTGARVTEAKHVAAAGEGPARVAEHCRVFGAIRPLDPLAPDIRFSVALPSDWNRKTLMLGGGGMNGIIPNVIGQQTVGPIGAPPPVSRGYAVFASDSGHQGGTVHAPFPGIDGSFALNDEALANYAGDALKKTRDTAMQIIARRYAAAPERNYFAGGSNGGREGFAAITRWPQDFDGAIIAYPYWNAVAHAMSFGRYAQAMSKPGAYVGPAKQVLLAKAVMDACDALDGARDGVISNQVACDFDLATLRCPGGSDADDTCLSDPQIAALRMMEDPVEFGFALGSGEKSFPGWPILSGAELRGPQQLGSTAPVYPSVGTQPLAGIYWEQLLRFAIARDPEMNPLQFDPLQPGPLQTRLAFVGWVIEVPTADYSAFASRGGKLLMIHGLADAIVTHRSSIAWWKRLIDRMGADKVRDFARFYTVPGYGHGPGGQSVFMAAWDSLPALEAWVESGKPPAPMTVSDSNAATRGRTRPLCEFPAWPKFTSGDLARAESFTCVGE